MKPRAEQKRLHPWAAIVQAMVYALDREMHPKDRDLERLARNRKTAGPTRAERPRKLAA